MAMTIGDRTLRFLFVPNLHWPDTMYTYIEEEQILMTCDPSDPIMHLTACF